LKIPDDAGADLDTGGISERAVASRNCSQPAKIINEKLQSESFRDAAPQVSARYHCRRSIRLLDPRLQSQSTTAKDGVNAVRTFLEHHGCVFQEVAQQNDFGKDGYLDFGEKGVVTFLCAALQIKSGASYRTAKGDYSLPVDTHAENWRKSTVPVFGLVYDPDDALIRWVDITGYLRAHPEQTGGSVPASGRHVLDVLSLRGAFKSALKAHASGGSGTLALNLLSPGPVQTDAVYDAWALSRSDAKYLLIMRRFVMDLEPKALRRAIFLLSHAGSHPNILWTKDNWIPPHVEEQILPSFRWSRDEIARMLRAADYSDWGYGTLGECLDVLFYEDPNIVAELHIAIKLLLKDPEKEHAVRAATLALTHSKDKRKELSALMQEHPALMDEEWFQEVSAAVNESGEFSLYI
jgi:hypothetical protein